MTEQKTEFNFGAFKDAFERKDLERWLPFYADEAEWIEYRHISPPRAANRMIGKQQIAAFLGRVCSANFDITIADEYHHSRRSGHRESDRVQCRLRLPGWETCLRACHCLR